ncbi:MAG: GNAT family N-acetyltransferase [Cyclobacteriaceae bacterium]|nr:GNAT family N-acetyltransferase [Cyclobacteriaceae bacterium]
MIIEKPEARHLSIIAVCHRKAFPDALSSAMGQHYVEKMLEWYLVDSRAFLFFIEEKGICVGYCGGLVADGKVAVGSASSMIQHSFNQAIKAILMKPWLLLHREFLRKYRLVIKNVWRRINKPKQAGKQSETVKLIPHTGLIVIGVDPEFHGKGYGSMLLQEFERQTRRKQYKLMMLTVLKTNTSAIESYKRNGWKITREQGNALELEKRIENL